MIHGLKSSRSLGPVEIGQEKDNRTNFMFRFGPDSFFQHFLDPLQAVVHPGGRGGHAPPPRRPVKISHKKMVTKGGRIDFMFLAPPLPHEAAESANDWLFSLNDNILEHFVLSFRKVFVIY